MIPKIKWSPSRKEMFQFGLVLIVGFGIIGALIYGRGRHSMALHIWEISGVIGILAIVIPIAARPFYWVWMGLALVLGTIMSRVVLFAIFFIVLTPVALFFKLIGRDALARKATARARDSYWLDHDEINEKSYYDHLF
jgi:hypothetical protein